MHPILFKIGNVVFYSYGLFVALGAFAALTYLRIHRSYASLEPKQVYDLVFYVIIGALVGGRVLYVLVNIRDFANPLEVFKIWHGGLIFYGGLAGGFAVLYYVVKRWGLSLLSTLDYSAPAIALAHSFGRMGCFFAGCCYGLETDCPLHILFTDPHSL
ncbi:MAG: prolipoprotein diacylglyceryl transferase, partial [Elusimicrobia bacterium]|nr:prolipoprotein diacylglyceryl transferase [Elusimicrobiota bacterium]